MASKSTTWMTVYCNLKLWSTFRSTSASATTSKFKFSMACRISLSALTWIGESSLKSNVFRVQCPCLCPAMFIWNLATSGYLGSDVQIKVFVYLCTVVPCEHPCLHPGNMFNVASDNWELGNLHAKWHFVLEGECFWHFVLEGECLWHSEVCLTSNTVN